jgi:hypothetical protein
MSGLRISEHDSFHQDKVMAKLAINLWKNEDRKDWQGFLEKYSAYWLSAPTRKALVAKLEDLNRKFQSGELKPAFTHEHDSDYWAAQPSKARRQAVTELYEICCGKDVWNRRIDGVLEVVDANGKVVKRWRGKREATSSKGKRNANRH